MKEAKLAFEEATQKDLLSGALKFTSDYVSRFQLFEAATKWAESDKNVLSISIRNGGGSQHAVDFRYDNSNNTEKVSSKEVLHKIFKPFFEKELGGNFMEGWDYASPTVLIK